MLARQSIHCPQEKSHNAKTRKTSFDHGGRTWSLRDIVRPVLWSHVVPSGHRAAGVVVARGPFGASCAQVRSHVVPSGHGTTSFWKIDLYDFWAGRAILILPTHTLAISISQDKSDLQPRKTLATSVLQDKSELNFLRQRQFQYRKTTVISIA